MGGDTMTDRLPVIGVIGNLKGTSDGHQRDNLAAIVGQNIANAGCNLLTADVGNGVNLTAKAFCLSPYRVGKSIGIRPLPNSTLKGRKSVARRTDWVEIVLSTSDSSAASTNHAVVGSADVLVAIAGGDEIQAPLENAIASGKPVIVLLGKGQKIGSYTARTKPKGVELAKDRASLIDKLSNAIVPFALTKPTFSKLKGVYETDSSKVHSCTIVFPNTCSIRMSEALDKVVSGITAKFKSSNLNVCKHDFMRGAQDLASVLRQADVFGSYDQGFAAPMQPPPSVKGKRGIICYMNIPTYPDGQGHIDLWDDDAPVGSSYWAGNPIWFWHLS